MRDEIGRLVRASAGRDAGSWFFVVGMRDGRLLLADGKRRKVGHPKAKQPKHVCFEQSAWQHPAADKLKQGQPVSDRELRRALAAFKEGNTLG